MIEAFVIAGCMGKIKIDYHRSKFRRGSFFGRTTRSFHAELLNYNNKSDLKNGRIQTYEFFEL